LISGGREVRSYHIQVLSLRSRKNHFDDKFEH
jgi:hypothetical protein